MRQINYGQQVKGINVADKEAKDNFRSTDEHLISGNHSTSLLLILSACYFDVFYITGK